jgi:hypothetical protein
MAPEHSAPSLKNPTNTFHLLWQLQPTAAPGGFDRIVEAGPALSKAGEHGLVHFYKILKCLVN